LGFFRKEELIALLYARRLFKEVPSPLGEEAAAVSARLEELFRATALAGVEEAISFDAGRKAEGSDRVFFDLLRAVIRRRVVRLHLDAPAEGESAVLEVEPLKLHVSAGSLRLVGHSRGRKGARIYPLGRIRRVEVTARQFAPPDTPVDAEALVRKGFRDGTARNVRIRFGPERAEWAAAQTGHPNRRLQWELDGSVVLELPETRFLEVLGLLLLSGGDAVVAAPAGLREAVRAEVERLAADYPAVSGPGRASPRKRKIFSAGKTGSK
jgi:predicted DNA-binding transcriptional regulator YafY